MNIILRLNSQAGSGLDNFTIYSDLDYTTPLATGVTRSQLLDPSGYELIEVPDGTTSLRIESVSDCTDVVDVDLEIVQPPVQTFLGGIEFVGSTSGAAPSYTWTNPDDPSEQVFIRERPSTAHLCDRGTYKIIANSHVNGGVVVGRVYVGNNRGSQVLGNPLFDTYVLNSNEEASSRTGDVAYFGVPSATAQYNEDPTNGLDSLGNNTTAIYNPGTAGIWPIDTFNSRQRYISSSFNRISSRATYFRIENSVSANVALNFPDPVNPNYVTFTLYPDTYERLPNTTIRLNTHTDAIWFQVFRLKDENNPNTEEIFADSLTTAQFNLGILPMVTFDASTGEYIEGYDPTTGTIPTP